MTLRPPQADEVVAPGRFREIMAHTPSAVTVVTGAVLAGAALDGQVGLAVGPFASVSLARRQSLAPAR